MIFEPKNLTRAEGSFVLPRVVCARAHASLNRDIIKEFWRNFAFQSSELHVSECEEYVFSVGNAERIDLDGGEYGACVEEGGIFLCAEDEKSLLRGFMTLIDRIRATEVEDVTAAEIECCRFTERATIPCRMAHFCVFPETGLWELQRFVRLCGALKYTHIVLEFWGMLRFDCMKELAWANAFTKEQIRPIIREARDLGLEVIPMFNHWGHASAGRVMHGKHVVLDQNPTLQPYFSEDGWCWDIRKPKVKRLLREIREELTALCGDGEYFHIGCDEAYNFAFSKENMDFICDFINEISEEMNGKGRKIIAWGDMFLYRHAQYNQNNSYSCNAPTPEAERYMLERLQKQVVIADWQYWAKEAPVETASVFRNAGFDSLLCPWDRGVPQLTAVMETVKTQSLRGFMHTTWHTLTQGMPYVTLAAVLGAEDAEKRSFTWASTSTAALLRRVKPCGGDYERAGWSRVQVSSLW